MSASDQQPVFRDWSTQLSRNAPTNDEIVRWFGIRSSLVAVKGELTRLNLFA
jgi:hypothetical protein